MQFRWLFIILALVLILLPLTAQDQPDHGRLLQQEKQELSSGNAGKVFPSSLMQKIDSLETQGKQSKDVSKAQVLLQQARWLLPEPQITLPAYVSKVFGSLKFKHDQYATAVVYAPDAKSLFTAGRDATLRQWNLQNGRTLKEWKFDQPLSALVVSPNGQYLAVAEGYRLTPNLDLSTLPTAEDYAIHVIELSTGKVKWKLNQTKSPCLCLAFSADSQWLASGHQYLKSDTLRIWNIADGKQDRAFKPIASVMQLAWSRDASKLYATTGDRTFCALDAKSGQQTISIRERGMIYGLAISPDESMVALGGDFTDDNSNPGIKLYSTKDWKLASTLSGHTGVVVSLVFSAKGDVLVSTSAKPEAAVKVWDVKLKTALTQYLGHTSDVLGITMTASGQNLATVSLDGSIRLWQSTQMQSARQLVKTKGPIWGIASQGNRILTVGADQTAMICDLETGQVIKRFEEHRAPVTAGAFRQDGKEVGTGGGDNSIRLWDPATGQTIKTLTGHAGVITSLAYSPDGKRLYSASADKTVRVWNIADGKAVITLDQHRSVVTSLAVNLDGTLLATGGADNIIRIWRTHDGSEVRSLIGHTGAITGLAFSPGGTLLASVGADGLTKIWEPATRSDAMMTFGGHVGQLMAVAFSPNNKYLATAGADEIIRVWNLLTGSEACALKGHTDWVTSLSYIGEGDTLLSASVDGTVQLWAETRAFEPVTFGHDQPIRYLAISPKGDRLASGSEEGKIILWDTATGNEVATLPGHRSSIKTLSFSHDSTLLVSADVSQVLKLWEVEPAKELQSLNYKSDGINRLAFLAKDRGIIASIGPSNIHLWPLEKKQFKPEPIYSFLGYERHCNSVAFAADQVALGGTDGNVKLWKINDFKNDAEEIIRCYNVAVHEITLSVDGKRLLASNQENEFKLWDVGTKKLILAWPTRPTRLNAFALNSKGTEVISSFDSNEVVLWDAQTGKELRSWKFKGPTTDLIFSPTTRHAYASTMHGVIYQLDLP